MKNTIEQLKVNQLVMFIVKNDVILEVFVKYLKRY